MEHNPVRSGAAMRGAAGVGRTLVVTAAVVMVSTVAFSLVMPALVPAFLIVPAFLLARRAGT